MKAAKQPLDKRQSLVMRRAENLHQSSLGHNDDSQSQCEALTMRFVLTDSDGD
jgi:hypothetical protein